jgi:hypothetical protein
MQSLPLTSEVQLTIADKQFLASHPELHHYTTLPGLEGIIRSNSLWAFHFSDLNDRTEVTLFREPLLRAVTESFADVIKTKELASLYIQQAIRANGGIESFAERVAKDFVEGLYRVTFENTGSFSFAEPFIASFCSHASDQPYEKKHGLLSQWRGYGAGGGYCIVFDTLKLSELLGLEFATYYWIYLQIAPVHYALDTASVRNLFPTMIERCDYFIAGLLEGTVPPPPDDAFAPFVAAATLFKHYAFSEEREVRIVAIPGSDEIQKAAQAEYPDQFKASPLKDIRMRDAGNGKRRYIALFETLGAQLPIKRVIVGPSRYQNENYERAKTLLGQIAPVSLSATPFIG